MSGPSRHSGIISDAAVNLMTVSRIGVIALLFSVGAIIAAGGGLARGGPPMQFTLISSAFSHQGSVP
jgi:Phosphatidylethanolamine-binding protein